MIDLQDLVRMIRRGWAMILIAAVIGGVAAGTYIVLTPRTYVSTTTLYVSVSAPESAETLDRASSFANRASVTYASVVDSPTVLGPVAARVGRGMEVDDLERTVTATRPTDTTLIEVAVYGEDPQLVADVANAVAEVSVDVIPQLEPGPRGPLVRLEQTNRAVIPSIAVSPNVRNLLQIGVVLGFLAGVGLTIVLQSLDTRVRERRDLQRVGSVPVLAEIPTSSAGPEDLIARDDPRSAAGEAFRVLRTNLGFVDRWTSRSVVVAAVTTDRGSSSVAANMAWTLAQSNHSVALVDANLRRDHEGASGYFMSNPSAEGLAEVVSGKVELNTAMREPLRSALHFLPAGTTTSLSPSDLLSTSSFAEVIRSLEKSYDFVIFDAPPISGTPDAAILASLVGGTILVVPCGKTRRKDVQNAVDSLAAVRVKAAGVVLHGTKAKPTGSGREPASFRPTRETTPATAGPTQHVELDSPTLRQVPVQMATDSRSPSPVPRGHDRARPSETRQGVTPFVASFDGDRQSRGR